jgi:hypothetical protein
MAAISRHREISDRVIATALVRLAQIESGTEMPTENARQQARIALDEIAELAPVLAIQIVALRERYKRG